MSEEKSKYHKSKLFPISFALNGFFKIPKDTKIVESKNGVTFAYPSGKKYTRYFKEADPMVVKKRLPVDTEVVQKKDRTIYRYSSGKTYTEYEKRR